MPCVFGGVDLEEVEFIVASTYIYIYTLQGPNISPEKSILSRWFSELPQVGYVNFLEGIYTVYPKCEILRSGETRNKNVWATEDF